MNGARVETRHHQWRDWRIRLRIWKVRESGSLLIQLVSWCYLEVAMKVVGLVCEEHTDVINSKFKKFSSILIGVLGFWGDRKSVV